MALDKWYVFIFQVVANRKSEGIKFQRGEFQFTSEERPELDLPGGQRDNLYAEDDFRVWPFVKGK